MATLQLNLVVRNDCRNSVAVPFNKDDADVVAEFMVANAEVRDAKALGGMHTDAQSKLSSQPDSHPFLCRHADYSLAMS